MLVGGVAAGVIGPQTVIFTRHLFDPIPFAGGFFAICGLTAIGALLLLPLSGAARGAFRRSHSRVRRAAARPRSSASRASSWRWSAPSVPTR